MNVPAVFDTVKLEPGQFMAVFPDGHSAGEFFDRLTANPGGDYAIPDSIARNRRGGRVVRWQVEVAKLSDSLGRPVTPATMDRCMEVYWRDMCETVGHYGTTIAGWARHSGNPSPDGATSDKLAWLNGRACQCSY